MVEQIFEALGVEVLIAQQIKDDARVKIPRACSHRNPAGGSESHGRIDRGPVSQRAQARSITKMRKNGPSRKLRAEIMHQRLIRNAVETITANPSLEVA